MLKHLSEQCEKVAFPLIGAGIGAVIALGEIGFNDAIVFLIALLFLLTLHSAASKYFDAGHGFIGLMGYILFFLACIIAIGSVGKIKSFTCSGSFLLLDCEIIFTNRELAFILIAYLMVCVYMACFRVVGHVILKRRGAGQ